MSAAQPGLDAQPSASINAGLPSSSVQASGKVTPELLADFRSAFSHLDRQGDSICGWLTDTQSQALKQLYDARGLVPKEHWQPEQLHDATELERHQLDTFRQRLKEEGHLEDPDAHSYCGDLTLLRYLRARDHHLDHAHHMLVRSLAWRAEHKPWRMESISSRTNKMTSDARIVGLDPQGRVVVYSSFSHTTERSPAKVTEVTVTMMEKACQCMAAHTPSQVVWVNHFCGRHKRGFGWADANPRFAWSGLNVFLDHYPECLKTMVIVDPPSIFFTVWKLIKPLLPHKTQEKGDFVHSNGPDTRSHFIDLFGPELAEYLLALIERDNNVP